MNVGDLSLRLTSSVDVLSGNTICSNTTFEFTCIASGVDTLGWKKTNGTNLIIQWNVNIKSTLVQVTYRDPFKVYLDKFNISRVEGVEVFANFTSRLVGTVGQGLHSGDEIRCLGTGFTVTQVMESLSLNYSIVTGK